jgi:hypothetical protein
MIRRLSRMVCHHFEEVKTHQMISRGHVCAIVLSAFALSFIIISASLVGSCVQATADINNKSNLMLHGSSSLFTNGSHDANQSFTVMTMMNMSGRGDIAMGFNQNNIVHRFLGTPVGGEIIITAINGSDRQTINQIKNHITEIQKEFSEGNFTKPFFIHAQEVPGTKVMTQKKELIKYEVLEMSNGSSLLLTTNDKDLIGAINQFMEFQAREHYGH